MGFDKVYKSLQEIFPQIDARLLRAVAIEHSNEVDAAVEAVLSEIIPFFTEQSRARTPLTGSISIRESSEGAIATTQAVNGSSVNAVNSTDRENVYIMGFGNQQSLLDDGQIKPIRDTYEGCHEGEGRTAELTLSENVPRSSMQTNVAVHSHGEVVQLIDKDGVNALQVEVQGNPKTEEINSDYKYPNSSLKNVSDNIPSPTVGTPQDELENIGIRQNMNLFQEREESGNLEIEFGTAMNKESDQGKSSGDGDVSVVGSASLTAHDQTASSLNSSSQLFVLHDMNGSHLEESGASLPNKNVSEMGTASKVVGTGDESTLNVSISESSQINIIDVLEEIITDARNNKKTLFSAMHSVISLMRDVELKEQAAEQAKVEAAMNGTDILVKSEEFKRVMQQEKEANAMHAGEVYGEKAILATELRELQSRVLSLSDERDKSLAVLDEMRQTLEVRLAEAQNEIKSAEHEKMEKEKAAMKALADQELIMEKVVQESKILNQQAEDNAKLRDFLVDRGHVVDMLQGEIAVICQDVKLLKEKFDEHVPFSKSLSSSQTSCLLASCSASSRSSIAEQVDSLPDGVVDSEEIGKKSGPVSCSSERSFDEKAGSDYGKTVLDDGWELF